MKSLHATLGVDSRAHCHVSTDNYAYPSVNYGLQSSCEGGFLAPCSLPAGVRTDAVGDQSAARISLDVPLVDGLRVPARVDAQATQIGVPDAITFLTPTAPQIRFVTLRGFNLGNEFASPIFGYPASVARYFLEISTR